MPTSSDESTTVAENEAIDPPAEETFPTNRIINADCLKALPEFPDACIDLTVFSPPYDNIRDYTGEWNLDYHTLGEQLLRVTKPGGIAAVVIGDGTKNFAKSMTTFRWAVDWVDRVGWRLFECCIYARHGNPGAWWTQRSLTRAA
jgi:site-specific DNA-methyltransferase (adenine-specific)